MQDFDGRVAAITGAGSGIGRALALELARRGTGLALSDIDPDGLAETVEICRRPGVPVTSRLVDVADRAAVDGWAAAARADHGDVDLVVNNAGVALGATVAEMPYDDLRWLMGINFWGVVHGTQAFLPAMLARDQGHVVNVSSVFGLISVPSQAAYNAAKFAVRGYTDCLRIELEAARSGVTASTVHPGGVRTNIVRSARMHESVSTPGGRDDADQFDRLARTTPEQAALQILDGIVNDRARILVGPDARVIDLVARVPELYRRIVVRGARRQLA